MPAETLPAPVLYLTPGEPAGIGPDLVLRLAARGYPAPCVVVADPALLRERARHLGIDLTIEETDEPTLEPAPGRLPVLPVTAGGTVTPGRLDPTNAGYVLETLRRATAAVRERSCAALVTGPVHKGCINDAGFAFSGHTEFLAAISGVPAPVMLLVAGSLRVALATTHLPLRDVPAAIRPDTLRETLEILHHHLRTDFRLPDPRILVAGLNPHAGEGGHLGREEIEVITPVLQHLRNAGQALEGPLPADTLFTPQRLAEADAVLAMYHDQGLPVLKHVGFGHAVNVTLGLPFVRTSVDHGTALELAGTGRAETGSLEAALQVARELAGARAQAGR